MDYVLAVYPASTGHRMVVGRQTQAWSSCSLEPKKQRCNTELWPHCARRTSLWVPSFLGAVCRGMGSPLAGHCRSGVPGARWDWHTSTAFYWYCQSYFCINQAWFRLVGLGGLQPQRLKRRFPQVGSFPEKLMLWCISLFMAYFHSD